MAINIEIKARCLNLEASKRKVKELASEYLGVDFQTDTYYKVKNGRLKLRESKIDGVYLIPYLRRDHSGPELSRYAKILIDNVEEVKYLFEKIFEIHLVVQKTRDIYIYENVRIHLDKVDHLGEFIELEATMTASDYDPEVQRKKINYLMKFLGIKKEYLVAESYESLLKKKNDK